MDVEEPRDPTGGATCLLCDRTIGWSDAIGHMTAVLSDGAEHNVGLCRSCAHRLAHAWWQRRQTPICTVEEMP